MSDNETILNVKIDATEAEVGARKATSAFQRMLDKVNAGSRKLKDAFSGNVFEKFDKNLRGALAVAGISLDKFVKSAVTKLNKLSNEIEKALGKKASSQANNMTAALRKANVSFSNLATIAAFSLNSIQRNVTSANAAINLIPGALGTTIRGFRGLGNIAGAILSTVKGLATGIVTAIAAVVTSVPINAIIEAGLMMQRFRTTMTVVTGSVAEGTAQLAELRKMTDNVGISFEQAAGPFAKFAAASKNIFSKEETLGIFSAFADASAALRLNQQEINGVFLALQQMASKGNVSMEELRLQLAERIPGAMDLAAKSMGVSIEQLEKLIRQGKVKTQNFLVGFAALIKDQFSGAAEVASKSAVGAFARLQNAIFEAKTTIADAGLLKALEVIATKFTEILNNTPLVKEFGKVIGDFALKIGDLLLSIKPAALENFLSGAVKLFESLLNILLNLGTTTFVKFLNGELDVQKRSAEMGSIIATIEVAAKSLGGFAEEGARAFLSQSVAGNALMHLYDTQIPNSVEETEKSVLKAADATLSFLVGSEAVAAELDTLGNTKAFEQLSESAKRNSPFKQMEIEVTDLRTVVEQTGELSFIKWLMDGSISGSISEGLSLIASDIGIIADRIALVFSSDKRIIPKNDFEGQRAAFETYIPPVLNPAMIKKLQDEAKAAGEILRKGIFQEPSKAFTTGGFTSPATIQEIQQFKDSQEAITRLLDPNTKLNDLLSQRTELQKQILDLSSKITVVESINSKSPLLRSETLAEQTKIVQDQLAVENELLKVNTQIAKLTKKTTSDRKKGLTEEEKALKIQQKLLENNLKLADAFNRKGDPNIEINEKKNQLLELKRLTDDQGNRILTPDGARAAEAEIHSLQDAMLKLGEETVKTEKKSASSFGNMRRFANQAARNIQDAFADFFFDPFGKGLDGLVKGFADAMRRMLANALTIDFLNATGLGDVIRGFGQGGSKSATLGLLSQVGSFFGLSGSGKATKSPTMSSFIAGLFGSGSAVAGGGASVSTFDIASVGVDLATSFTGGVTNLLGSGISAIGQSLGSAAVTQFATGFGSSATAGIFGPGGAAYLTGAGPLTASSSAAEVAAAQAALAAEFGELAVAGASAASAFTVFSAGLAGVGVGSFAGGLIAGDKGFGKLSGQNASLAGAVTGAAIGTMIVPVLGTFIGGVLGGLIGGLSAATFGLGPRKVKQTRLAGVVTSEGITGTTNTNVQQEGGIFRGNKNRTVIVDINSGEVSGTRDSKSLAMTAGVRDSALKLGEFLNDAIGNIADSTQNAANVLRLGSSALDNFSLKVKAVSANGKFLGEKQIDKLLNQISDAMVTAFIPAIAELAKKGETVTQTFQRLAVEFASLTNGIQTIFQTSFQDAIGINQNVSFGDRTKIIDALGGIEEFNGKMLFLADNFLSELDRTIMRIQRTDDALSEFGVTSAISKDQFFGLIKTFAAMGLEGTNMLNKLIAIAPEFLEIKKQAEAVIGTDNTSGIRTIATIRAELIASYEREKESLEALVERMSRLADGIKDFRDSLQLGELSPLTPGEKLAEASQQFNEVRRAAEGGDEVAIAKLPDAARAFLEASQRFNASSPTFVSDFNFVTAVLDNIEGVARTEAQKTTEQLQVMKDSFGLLGEIEEHTKTFTELFAEFLSVGLSGPGNPNLNNDQIKALVSGQSGTQQKVTAINNNISGAQLDAALASTIPTNTLITDDQIREFVSAPGRTAMEIYNAAIANGISSVKLTSVTGFSKEDIDKFVTDNNLAKFERGTDRTTRKGIAMLHANEAVVPSSVPDEIVALRNEVAQLRREQNAQMSALINVTISSNKENADSINRGRQDEGKTQAWRQRSEASIR